MGKQQINEKKTGAHTHTIASIMVEALNCFHLYLHRFFSLPTNFMIWLILTFTLWNCDCHCNWLHLFMHFSSPVIFLSILAVANGAHHNIRLDIQCVCVFVSLFCGRQSPGSSSHWIKLVMDSVAWRAAASHTNNSNFQINHNLHFVPFHLMGSSSFLNVRCHCLLSSGKYSYARAANNFAPEHGNVGCATEHQALYIYFAVSKFESTRNESDWWNDHV